MDDYQDIVIQTYESGSFVRARAVNGQGFPANLNVECSKKMRDDFPVGTFFIVQAKITDCEGAPFLYTHYSWPYKKITPSEAKRFISKQRGKYK